ncbi:MAG: hypothetical protein LBE57_02075, partial [Methanosarcinales archaeon]|nr:hypothetical protein [Methanosarcinales archaeon]
GKAPGAVRIGGFAYSATNLAAGSVVSDNIVRVDGRIQSLSDTENAQTAGFVTFANRETANNVVYARDGVWGAGNPAGFSLSANDNAQIRGNTWLGRPGEIVPTTPETRADYRNFIITPADSDNAGNFYTSVLEGQRISNELVYNGTTLLWEPISVERRPLLEVSSRTDNSSSQIYIIAKDAGVGTLGLAGPDASKASLAGNNLTMPAGSIVLLTAVEGGKTVVKDIAGIGHVYSHGNVTGNIFWDGNNNGVKDAGEAVADIEVKAYYRDGEVTSNQTDSNGDYIIQIPLLAVINPEIVLEMEIPEGYHSSNHSNNDFTSLNQLRFNLNWTVPVSGQIGILAGGSSPPIVPPGGGGGNGTGNGTVNNSTPPGGNGSDNGTPPGGNGSDNGTPPGGGGGPEEIGVFLILLIFALAVAFFIFRKKREIDEEDKHLEDSANNQQK